MKVKKKVNFAKLTVDEYFDSNVECEFENDFESDYKDVYPTPRTTKAWVSLFE